MAETMNKGLIYTSAYIDIVCTEMLSLWNRYTHSVGCSSKLAPLNVLQLSSAFVYYNKSKNRPVVSKGQRGE